MWTLTDSWAIGSLNEQLSRHFMMSGPTDSKLMELLCLWLICARGIEVWRIAGALGNRASEQQPECLQPRQRFSLIQVLLSFHYFLIAYCIVLKHTFSQPCCDFNFHDSHSSCLSRLWIGLCALQDVLPADAAYLNSSFTRDLHDSCRSSSNTRFDFECGAASVMNGAYLREVKCKNGTYDARLLPS